MTHPTRGEAVTREHYTDGRRWSHISQAWILLESWNDQEEIASLKAQLITTLAASGNMATELRSQLQATTERAERLQAEVYRLQDERERPCKGCGL